MSILITRVTHVTFHVRGSCNAQLHRDTRLYLSTHSRASNPFTWIIISTLRGCMWLILEESSRNWIMSSNRLILPQFLFICASNWIWVKILLQVATGRTYVLYIWPYYNLTPLRFELRIYTTSFLTGTHETEISRSDSDIGCTALRDAWSRSAEHDDMDDGAGSTPGHTLNTTSTLRLIGGDSNTSRLPLAHINCLRGGWTGTINPVTLPHVMFGAFLKRWKCTTLLFLSLVARLTVLWRHSSLTNDKTTCVDQSHFLESSIPPTWRLSILLCLQSTFVRHNDVTLDPSVFTLNHEKNSGKTSSAIGVIRVTVQSAHIFKNKFLVGSPDPFVSIRINSNQEHACTKHRYHRYISRSFHDSPSIITNFFQLWSQLDGDNVSPCQFSRPIVNSECVWSPRTLEGHRSWIYHLSSWPVGRGYNSRRDSSIILEGWKE